MIIIQNLSINKWLFFSFVILVLTQVVVLNHYSTSGNKLSSLTQNINVLQKENSQLNQKIASGSAIFNISQRAKEYGLDNSQFIVSLSNPLPLAYHQKSSY